MIYPTSFLEIDAGALRENLKFLKRIAGKNRDILHVVKGNAYGHGIEQFVPLLQRLGANSFGVFDAYEAYRVKQVVHNQPRIIIMGMIDAHEIEWAIIHNIEFYVFDVYRLSKAIDLSKTIGKKAKVHIEVETGMNRTGFEWKDRQQLIKLLENDGQFLEVKGVCTHFAGAESIANYLRVKNQYKMFNKWTGFLDDAKVDYEQIHTACSAAAIRYPKTKMDMIRTGILQYGFWPSEETLIEYLKNKTRQRDPLRRVISWKSTVMSIKTVSKGDYVGYGTSYLASFDMVVATVPIGYAHGFARSLSNQGRVLIRGERTMVIGTVNMNMMVVDITNIKNVEPGDEVVIIGHQKDQSITVSSFSDFSSQLNYELLTRLPREIPRVVNGNGYS